MMNMFDELGELDQYIAANFEIVAESPRWDRARLAEAGLDYLGVISHVLRPLGSALWLQRGAEGIKKAVMLPYSPTVELYGDNITLRYEGPYLQITEVQEDEERVLLGEKNPVMSLDVNDYTKMGVGERTLLERTKEAVRATARYWKMSVGDAPVLLDFTPEVFANGIDKGNFLPGLLLRKR